MNEQVLLNVFFAYAREDSQLRERLDRHLATLKRKNFINTWYDGKIEAGKEWEEEINKALSTADIILLLISVDFIASDYCYDVEMKKALLRHEKGEAVIIPIILHPCDWRDTPFSKLQVLPSNGEPITGKHWENKELALREVSSAIKETVDSLRKAKNKRLNSISEVLKERDNELKIVLEQLEESRLEQEILLEEIEDLKIQKEEMIKKLEQYEKMLLVAKEGYEKKIRDFENILSKLQVKVNRQRRRNENLLKEEDKLRKRVEKLGKTENNLKKEIEKHNSKL